MLQDPEYLLLDEPFSGLDLEGVRSISDIIRDLVTSGVGILISSHQIEIVSSISDRVSVISKGRVVVDGNLSDVLNNAQRILRLVFEYNSLTPEQKVSLETFINKNGGESRYREQSIISDFTIPPGENINNTLMKTALEIGNVSSFELIQPSLRDILETKEND